MKKLYTVILLLFTLTAWSQDIPMQVVAAGGGYFESTVAGMSISWTMGEVAYTTLKTSTSTYILTQGFQQGNLFSTSVEKPTSAVNGITIYPNPAKDYVKIRIDVQNVSGKALFELYDITGRRVISEQMVIEQSEPVDLDLSELRSGIYLLKIVMDKDKLNRTVKLVKE